MFRPQRAVGCTRHHPLAHLSSEEWSGGGEGAREVGRGCGLVAEARTQASPLPGLLPYAGRQAGAHVGGRVEVGREEDEEAEEAVEGRWGESARTWLLTPVRNMVSSDRPVSLEDEVSHSMKEMIGGCCVCSDERGWAENPLVYCDGHGCSVAVHQGKHPTARRAEPSLLPTVTASPTLASTASSFPPLPPPRLAPPPPRSAAGD
ncbi:Protein AF-10 [Galemys pyrenaicus]|uniref:Protein AF-10 n=1 Tax=Galemys pyrenaicus TaxID=202257 RepID=A0A8J6A8M7_GALPY|nr:Protein AF-10 [Galemys pyrenaicus]